jgi:hypothetical protein
VGALASVSAARWAGMVTLVWMSSIDARPVGGVSTDETDP